MAIIKCPECGRQISDKAPTCPSCGVEIAGKITKCPNCGEIYFSNLEMCPNCHELNPSLTRMTPPTGMSQQTPASQASMTQQQEAENAARQNAIRQEEIRHQDALRQDALRQQARPQTPVRTATPPTPPVPPVRPQQSNSQNGGNGEGTQEKKKSNRGVIIISLIFAFLVCGIFYYFYDSANKNKELEAYEYAMQSSDPMVLQSYLDTYKDADEAHRDSIMAHLELLKQTDQDWTNAVVSGSKEALQAYLDKYPNSPHKQEVLNKIDSIDWNVAKNADNVEAYQAYLAAHADGSHIEEAENAMKKAKSRDLQPEEKDMVSSLFRHFFQSINTRDADGLQASCEDILSSLLGKNSATKADVVTFMNKLYKEDVTNLNWFLTNDYKIKKREVGDEDYEYQVQFSAREEVQLTDGTKKTNHFKINATVSPDGKVSAFNMSKINAAE
ncbi:zinc ribbon domain-containing protein [Prevotella copri]|uniref:Zinc ribbon domain-containing protein n=1 Tax=Segatella copri TaxID=165179 RepID=A0AAW4YLL2_9BACT|nr:zinc ribbon domain-containing protein [Segatella copri]MCE4122468.1 zinc ribbon domain-containing protein [Segatella copri]MCP9498859.1 zinc ribbon domain-containing protein [Segatella copri]MCP9513136.1 zinc ribbon domain-containing protein [Segatella copri]MCP9522724.1 zinc ribbon domain-containing protein [Segatella copri]